MNRQTRRILKIYLRLAWIKLDYYYNKLNSAAYTGAVILNPYNKINALRNLWAETPEPQSQRWIHDSRKGLESLWESHYKHQNINSSDEPPISEDYEEDAINIRGFIALAMNP
jgi:hypothetical protein